MRRYAGSIGRTAQGTNSSQIPFGLILSRRHVGEIGRRTMEWIGRFTWKNYDILRHVRQFDMDWGNGTFCFVEKVMLIRYLINRQGLGCLPRPVAREVGRVPSRSAQERRVQRRCQGSRHQQPDRQAHPGQPGPQAAPPHIPCPRSRKLTRLTQATAYVPNPTFTDIGRQINPYMSNPCHIELILTEGEEVVQKSEAVVGREHLSSRQRGARVRRAITAA